VEVKYFETCSVKAFVIKMVTRGRKKVKNILNCVTSFISKKQTNRKMLVKLTPGDRCRRCQTKNGKVKLVRVGIVGGVGEQGLDVDKLFAVAKQLKSIIIRLKKTALIILCLFSRGFANSQSKNYLFQRTNASNLPLYWHFYSWLLNSWSNIWKTYLPRLQVSHRYSRR
jgi:hypothetical protein